MQKKNIDPSKLFGFKILEDAKQSQTGDAANSKIAAKVGTKPPAVKLGSKIGGKVGVKPVIASA
ncbi:MAG: hypothetical protein PHR30_13995 [Gallionellaceae bacterium]|nr:hypothetical protein [Gallionellaceae bacterium]MDD5366445.1 hypothetical protein [Gallionellaceae bacterium]